MIATSTPAAAGQLEHRLDRIGLAAADRRIGRDDGGGHVESLAVQLDEEHARGPARAEPAGRAGSRSGPAPMTTTSSPGADPDQLLGVDRAGERLGDGGLVEPDAVGDPVEAVDRQHLRGGR